VVGEHLAHVGADLDLTEYLGSIEPDDAAIGSEEKREVTCVPFVPRLQKLAVQLASIPVCRGID
jgi:hypothetical protein